MGRNTVLSFDPDDLADELEQDVVVALADKMDASDVAELIGELNAAATITLEALDAMPAYRKGYDVVTLMQRIRSIRKAVEDGVEAAESKAAADAAEMRDHYRQMALEDA